MMLFLQTARLKNKRNRLDIAPVSPVPRAKRRDSIAVDEPPRSELSSDDELARTNDSISQTRLPLVRPKKRRKIAGSSQTTEPEEAHGLRVEGKDAGSSGAGGSQKKRSLAQNENIGAQADDTGMLDPEQDGLASGSPGLPDKRSSLTSRRSTIEGKEQDRLVGDVDDEGEVRPDYHSHHVAEGSLPAPAVARSSTVEDLARMFDDDAEVEDEDENGSAEEPDVKVKSEKALGKRPQRDLSSMFEDNGEDDDVQAFPGNNFVDLTEDDVGDEYEPDKYELTQEPTVEDDDDDLDPGLGLGDMDDFDAFDWDPSQPLREASPEVDVNIDGTARHQERQPKETKETLINPLRTISSLPEKLKQFYLTHWCRTSTRKAGELVGPEAQLANDRVVQAEVAAAVDKRMRGKTWENTALNRAGKSTSGTAAGARGGRGGGRGGARGAVRGKAFFIQRAMRARRGRGK